MSDDHRQIFIHESREQITELNNSLLSLESNPEDAEAMDAIFRTAHTLKGNSAAMGYDDASTLAHALEDLLDEVRQGRIEITPELMDRHRDRGVLFLRRQRGRRGVAGAVGVHLAEPADGRLSRRVESVGTAPSGLSTRDTEGP